MATRQRGHAKLIKAGRTGTSMGEASMDINGQQVITRIGFAERWLDRARRQCQDGDVTRGLLTLVLANAEMAHAIRTAQPRESARRQWILPAVAAIAAIAVSSAVGVFGGWQVHVSAPAPTAGAPIIVTLGDGVGSLLQPVQSAPQIGDRSGALMTTPRANAPAVRSSSRITRPIRVIAPAENRAVPTAAAPAPVVQQPIPIRAPAATVQPPAATVAEDGLSQVELIDLVLAAERTLRRQSQP